MELLGHKVVLKALVGSWNYNLGRKEDLDLGGGLIIKKSDKDYKLFGLPTFEELYKGERFKHTDITATEDREIHDVRKMPELFFKSNLAYLEILHSKELWINEEYEEMKEIYELRDDIFKMNLPQMFNSLGGTFRQKLSLIDKGTEGTQYLVDQFGYDTKQAQHGVRYIDFGIKYAESDFTDAEGALRYTGEDLVFMQDTMNGLLNRDTYVRYAKFIDSSRFRHLKEKFHSQPVNYELKEHLDNLVMKMVEKHITGRVA
jgi:hypothetical protein